MIENIVKQGAYIVFNLTDGSNVKYDLANNITIGKRGQPVKGLSSQLSGTDLWLCEHLFKDNAYFRFLQTVARRTNCRTLAGALKHVKEYSNLEAFCRLGIDVHDNNMSVSHLPKDMLRYIVSCTGTKGSFVGWKQINVWKQKHDIIQSVLSCRNDDTKSQIDSLMYHIVVSSYLSYNTGEYECNFFKLIRDHNYEPKALTQYLLKIDEYEGVKISSALNELYDYVAMQVKMKNEYFEKYPRCLLTTHAIAVRNYNRIKEEYNAEAFAATYTEKLEMTIGRYSFICPKTPEEIKDEALQQQHCVASYIDRVIAGQCHIIFMRSKDDKEHSLVTLEVREGRVVQKRGKLNRRTTFHEDEVIGKYEACLAKKIAA